MNQRAVTLVIDSEKCIGCGACIRVCTSDTLTLINGAAHVTGDKSLSCGHCAGVCPQDAIQVNALDREMGRFNTFKLDPEWLPFGEYPTADLARLMASRRSCRNFKDTPVNTDMLDDLVKIGTLAPSGTNSQAWTFTCLPDRKAVLDHAHQIKHFFQDLNKKAEKKWLRKGLALLGMKALDNYYQEYYESVTQALDEMERNQTDRLFHGATACILIGSGPDASCPKEDALLAASNILLAAHTMGLGSCLIGFAVAAMSADKKIQKQLGVPGKEKIYAVIALGYPDESYLKITGRKKPVIRYYQAKDQQD